MKIPASIRELHADQDEINKRLKVKVDDRIKVLKPESWHYESRVKKEQSFALKVETGRVANPAAMEDFFACTLVVRNGTEIDQAEKLIMENFVFRERKPEVDNQTHKAPDAFPFDDLRLYVEWRDDPDLPHSGVVGVRFEVQIKTFLQHAWTIATHNLVYKSDTVSWSKQRIAYQIKAMLEHAEISIQEAERLAACNVLAKTDSRTANIQEYINLVTSEWDGAELPEDIRRLAENISGVMRLMGLGREQLDQALKAERDRGSGTLPSNLSPYAVILQALMKEYPEKFKRMLIERRHRQHIVIPVELELSADIDQSLCRNAIFLGRR